MKVRTWSSAQSFAVKELNTVDRRWTYRVEDGFTFERAARSTRCSASPTTSPAKARLW